MGKKVRAPKSHPSGRWNPEISRDVIPALGLLCLLILVYMPALHGGLVWDDEAHITAPQLRSWNGLWRIWFDFGATQQYYPLLHSAFWLEHWLWGDSVFGYHLINVLLHGTSAFLLMLILRRLALPGAGLAAVIFAVHPVCVESVAWISEQKNTLSGLFYLSSALFYLRFDGTRKRSLYFWALTLFIAALLSKSVTATLPAALLVVLWWQRRKLDWKRDVPLLPWLVIGLASGLLTSWVEKRFIGAQGDSFDLTMLQRGLLAGRIVWFYAGKIVWPSHLMFIYPRWTIDPAAWWQYTFPAGVLVVGVVLIALARRMGGPLAALLFFIGTLVPALGFLNVYPFIFSYVADHFQYLASLGIIVPAAWAITTCTRRIPAGASWLGSLVVTVLAILTWTQSGTYQSGETLYRSTLVLNPTSWMAESNLGSELMRTPGRAQEAAAHLEAALRLKPDLAEPHNNLGLIFSDDRDRLPEAIAEFQIALRMKPNWAEAHNNLGSALSDAGHREDAIAQYREALRVNPSYAEAHNNLGSALSELPDRMPEAIAEFEAALAIDPNLAEAHANLGSALAKSGRVPEAIMHLETAVRIRPGMKPWQQMLAQLQGTLR
jgi:tetratricopeptide (TPR) repeat protein